MLLVVAVASLAPVAFAASLASHELSAVSLGEAHAFRHVLETDDRLFLVRYSVVDEPPDGESTYGAAATVLQLVDGATIASAQNPPGEGHRLAAIYQPASDASLVTWADALVFLRLTSSPTLYSPQDVSTAVPTWHTTSSATATADALVSVLPDVLVGVESDDANVTAGSYVTSAGITDAGAVLVELAFPGLIVIAGDAFQTAVVSLGDDVTAIPAPGTVASDLEVTGQASAFTQDVTAAGATFGIPALGVGILLLLLLLVASGALNGWIARRGDGVLHAPGGALLAVAYTGLFPLQVVAGICVTMAVVGSGIVINRWWPR